MTIINLTESMIADYTKWFIKVILGTDIVCTSFALYILFL